MPRSDSDILQEVDDTYENFMRINGDSIDESYDDLRMFLGDQWKTADKHYLRDQGRSASVYNKIHRVIKMITGNQRRNRLSSICDPVEGSDEETAELFTDCLLYLMQQQNGYNVLSDAFEGCLITGMNLMSIWMDYTEDYTNGDIKIGREPFNSFIYDPYFTGRDLLDCRYITRRRYMDPDAVKMLLPEQAKDIDKIPSGRQDDKFKYMPYSMHRYEDSLLAYDEHWTRTNNKRKLLIDNMTGETRHWKGSTAQLKEFIKEYPWVESVDIWVPGIHLDVIVNRVVLYSDDEPWGLEDYPFVPVIAYYESQYDDSRYKMQGVVRKIKDAQDDYNKKRSKGSDIIDSQVNSGWIVVEGKVTNKADLYRTGQGVVIERTRDSEPADVQKIPAPELPQTFFSSEELLNKDIIELSGANEELMGVAEGGNTQISGILAKERAANGLTTLRDLLDNLSLSQKFLGQKCLKLMQVNWDSEKVARITGKEVTEEFYDKNFGKYDCVVREAALTDTQKNLAYAEAIGAKEAGVAIPDSFVIKMMPIANKKELLEAYEQEAQQAQQQQQKLDEQEEMIKELQKAKIVTDLSLAAERQARVEADIGLAKERISEMQQNNAQALLDKAKAVKELEGMDLDKIQRQLALLQQMQDMQIAQAQAIEGVSEQKSQQNMNEMVGFVTSESTPQQPQQAQQPVGV